jgi:hypothetical protein
MAQPRTRSRPKTTEFVNVTQGWLGAIKINRRGEEDAVGIEPGHRIFLTDEEVEITEQSHSTRKASPFREREIVHNDMASGEVLHRFTAAPLTKVDDIPEELRGRFLEDEEIGTPIPA